MKKVLIFCLFVLCNVIAWSQKAPENLSKKKIIVLDVPNGKIDLQKATKQLISKNNIKKGSKATYTSEQELVFTDGFVAENGSEFIGEIENNILDNLKEKAIANQLFTDDIRVYPNPTSENLFINLPTISSGNMYMVGTSGQVVFERRIDSEKNMVFSIDELPAGIYIFRVVTENYEYRKKILKK